MNLSRSNWLLVAVSAALSFFGFWAFVGTLSPIPESILTVSGTVTSAKASFRKGNISVIRFKLAPTNEEFSYPSILKNTQDVWNKIDKDMPVEVTFIRDPNPELWGLRVAGELLLTPSSAQAARRENGYWALAVGIGFFLSCMYLIFIEGRRAAA